MTLDGEEHTCSRGENPDLFSAVVAGLGYVGAVLEVTHRLLPVGIRAERLAVETTFEKVEGLDQIAKRLVDHVRARQKMSGHHTAADSCAAVERAEKPGVAAWAASVALYMDLGKDGVGLLATSTYADVPSEDRRRSVFHQPHSFLHWMLQLFALSAILRKLSYFVLFTFVYKANVKNTYHDDVDGYSFFEDGNRGLRYLLRSWGFPVGIRQQAYVIPYDWQNGDDAGVAVGQFLRASKKVFEEHGVSPVLIDVLYLPDDAGDDFHLCSSDDLAGFIVTFTFERLWSVQFPNEEAAYREVSTLCRDAGGRVHLPKSVHADPKDVAAMYAGGIQMMSATRARFHADLLSNEFRDRVLPGI
jgi:decaprenylphospho-beta-D-ribofuranose 2-oxidase